MCGDIKAMLRNMLSRLHGNQDPQGMDMIQEKEDFFMQEDEHNLIVTEEQEEICSLEERNEAVGDDVEDPVLGTRDSKEEAADVNKETQELEDQEPVNGEEAERLFETKESQVLESVNEAINLAKYRERSIVLEAPLDCCHDVVSEEAQESQEIQEYEEVDVPLEDVLENQEDQIMNDVVNLVEDFKEDENVQKKSATNNLHPSNLHKEDQSEDPQEIKESHVKDEDDLRFSIQEMDLQFNYEDFQENNHMWLSNQENPEIQDNSKEVEDANQEDPYLELILSFKESSFNIPHQIKGAAELTFENYKITTLFLAKNVKVNAADQDGLQQENFVASNIIFKIRDEVYVSASLQEYNIHFEEVYQVLERIFFVIWNWYYKDSWDLFGEFEEATNDLSIELDISLGKEEHVLKKAIVDEALEEVSKSEIFNGQLTGVTIDECIQYPLVVGNYGEEIVPCIAVNKIVDTLIIAHIEGSALWESVSDWIIDLWKEELACLCSFAQKEERFALCDTLASRLMIGGNTLAAAFYYDLMEKNGLPTKFCAGFIPICYTFSKSQEEFMLARRYASFSIQNGGFIESHHVQVNGQYKVIWRSQGGLICCSCHQFEIFGTLCKHALHILFANSCFQSSNKYLPSRWQYESSRTNQRNHDGNLILISEKVVKLVTNIGKLLEMGKVSHITSFTIKAAKSKHLGQEVYKILGKITFIIWSWYYKEDGNFLKGKIEKIQILISQFHQSFMHPGSWNTEWKIAWNIFYHSYIQAKTEPEPTHKAE